MTARSGHARGIVRFCRGRGSPRQWISGLNGAKMAAITVTEDVITGFRLNTPPQDFLPQRDLREGFLEFLAPLHRNFSPRRTHLAEERRMVLRDSHSGAKPVHRYPGPAVRNGWRIELPEWCQDQRNQMTGPADDAELVVKMLNSGAPGVMLDLEDSMANGWPNLMQGASNIRSALRGELTYEDRKRGRRVGIEPSPTVIWSRVRGLHLAQAGV